MVWLEGNMLLKNPVTTPGIDPGTIRQVAQRLNHCTTPGPYNDTVYTLFQNQTQLFTVTYRKEKQ